MRLRSLADSRDVADALRRVRTVRPDSPRHWGRMTAHQMVCHLADGFRMGTEAKPVSAADGWRERTVVKWIALYAPVAWPAGIMTRPEVDQECGGTRPTDFAADRAALEALIAQATTTPGYFAGRSHPIFGPLSEAAWLRWGYLHLDHHLRQFGA
jgi:hypothetical protein